MFFQDIQMVDIDPNHWHNLRCLVAGDFSLGKDSGKKGAGKPKPTSLTLVVKDGRCIKAVHSDKGLLKDYQPPVIDDARELAKKEGVSRAAIFEHGAIRRFMHGVQSKLSLDMNYGEQIFVILDALRDELDKGFRLYPRPKIPKINYTAVSSMAKGILPANELIVYVIHADDGSITDSSGLPIVTSIIARLNKGAELELLTTTDSLVPHGLKVVDWKKDYKKINALAEKVWGSKVFVAIHAPLSHMPEITRETAPDKQGPGGLLAFRKQGKLIIDPLPLRLRAMLKMGGMMGKK